jgi:hypothetical protein
MSHVAEEGGLEPHTRMGCPYFLRAGPLLVISSSVVEPGRGPKHHEERKCLAKSSLAAAAGRFHHPHTDD